MSYYQDKVAVVTGGAAGIGAELVHQLVAAGASVVIADVADGASQVLADKLNQQGARAVACRTDVSRFDDVERAVQTAMDQFGRFDLIINNAGVGLAGELRDVELADWRPIIDVNLWGVIHGVHAALPIMLRQGHGQIVNMASAAGLVPRPGMVPYATSKHAVVGLSLSLRYEVEDLGIRVNAVCPFNIGTAIFQNTKYRNIDHQAMLSAIPLRQFPVERCAEEILAGMSRDKAVMVMPRFARLEWWLYRHFPWAASRLLRRRKALFRNHRITP